MKIKFDQNSIYLPVTMKQFESLTNEILIEVNKLCHPLFLSADYLAQILMSAIHAMDHKHGRVLKSDLFESCVNRISCHVTYDCVQEIQAKLKAKEGTTESPSIDDPEDSILTPGQASSDITTNNGIDTSPPETTQGPAINEAMQ